MAIEWIRSIETAPPQDGTPFWAFLYLSGIRKMQWITADQRRELYNWGDTEECDGAYVETGDPEEEWRPEFWTPETSITLPAL